MFFFLNIHELECSGIGLIYVRFIKFFPILELVEVNVCFRRGFVYLLPM